ncbi:MAG: D-ribose pyranase [Dyella sp.]
MKRNGLLHAELNRVIAAMGHTDTLVIADVGLPIPPGVPCIDLAVLPGLPSFTQLFEAVWAELAVEAVTVASEIHARNPAMVALSERLKGEGVPLTEVAHTQFKQHCAKAYAIVRTGETSPYCNMILHAGVTF